MPGSGPGRVPPCRLTVRRLTSRRPSQFRDRIPAVLVVLHRDGVVAGAQVGDVLVRGCELVVPLVDDELPIEVEPDADVAALARDGQVSGEGADELTKRLNESQQALTGVMSQRHGRSLTSSPKSCSIWLRRTKYLR
jgi:hypothetical protein